MRWSSPLLFALLSHVTADAVAAAPSDYLRADLARPIRRKFGTTSFLSSTSSLWTTIPRGGDGEDDASNNSDDMLSSLLSGMNLPSGAGSDSAGKMLNDLMSQQPPSPEQIQQSMEQFTSLLSSPQFKEMLNDPAKLEASLETMRNSLLSALEEMEKGDNPMMKIMLEQMKSQLAQSFPGGWDGLKELIEDADKWKEMMGGLMDVMKSLGDEDWSKIMSQMMMGGMGGGMGGMGMGDMMSGMGGGNTLGDAFGGDTSGTLAGLDDLSEGED
ncbi:hypothetical protein ACHAXH_001237 [Discostella pseudostelligera]